MAPETGNVDSIGVILAVNGDVYLRSEDGLRQVGPGAEVYQGEELVTGPGSSAEVRFADDTLLSQGADLIISLDDYIFDPENESASTLLFKMGQGTFRMVTGKIAEQNPDRFQIGSPLATIGIRGTTTVHEITPDGGEKHGVEEIHSGKALLVQSIDGQIRVIDSPQALVDIAASGQISTVRPMTMQEFNSFREIAPEALQQEREIQEQQEQDDETQEQGEGQDDGEQSRNADAENQQEGAGDGVEGEPGEQGQGGEAGNVQIAGEGVLEPGVVAIIEGGIEEGLGVEEIAAQVADEVADNIFNALSEGDIGEVNDLLSQLSYLTSDEVQGDTVEDLILELIGTTAETTTGSSTGTDLEGQSVTTGDGISWTFGTANADTLEGTTETDYIDGLGGNDDIWGKAGNDTLKGGTGDDTLSGDTGADALYGDDGADHVDGLCDDDYVAGGDGDDILSGGNGNDSIDGGSGTDTLSFEYETGPFTVDMTANTATGGGYTDIFVNIENVTGSGSNDYIVGDSSANVLSGGNGNDTLVGGAGADTLLGGGGIDTLTGGAGSDTLTGGTGYDYFYYAASTDFGDKITDFESNNGANGDKLRFSSSEFNGAGFQTLSEYNSAGGSSKVFVWDSSSDILYYDADGKDNTSSSLVTVAEITANAEITSDNIEIA